MDKTVSQLLATSAASISTFSYGLSIGFTTILIPELRKKDAEIVVTIAELTWISSLNYFCQPLVGITGGFISRYCGRRNILSFSSLPFIIAWLLLYFSGSSVWPIFLGFMLLGIGSGLVDGLAEVYASEINEPRLRGIASSIIGTSIVVGIFTAILVGSFIYWRTLALISIIPGILSFVALCFVPESPYWLAGRDRVNDSQRSLAWLRGWTTLEHISNEFSAIEEALKSEKPETEYKYKIQRYFRRSVLLPFAMESFAFFVFAFGGGVTVLAYALEIFHMLDCPINEYTASILLAGLRVIGTMMMIGLVPWLGKRKTTFASLIIAGLSMMIVVIYTFLKDQQIIDQIENMKFRWIPTTFLSISIFAASFGIEGIPWVMSGEVFPGDVRAEMTGFVATMSNAAWAISSKVFLYMVDSMTLPGTFLFYAMVNFVGLGVLYFIMPETEGRTLAEIVKYFEGLRDESEKNNSWKNKKRLDYDNAAYE